MLVSPTLVERAKLIPLQMNYWDRVTVFLSIFCIAFAYTLDGCMRSPTFQVRVAPNCIVSVAYSPFEADSKLRLQGTCAARFNQRRGGRHRRRCQCT